MYKFIVQYFLFYIILQTSILSQDFIQLKKNITSLLNTTSIIDFNHNIVIASDGGLYIYDNGNYLNLNEHLNVLNISSLAVNDNYLWIGSKGRGQIQIFDENLNLQSNVEYPVFDEIIDITFTDNYAFAVVLHEQNYKIVQYNIENNDDPYYLNIFSSFPIAFEKINDINILEDLLYLATSHGLLSANYNDSILSFSSSWNISYNLYDISSILQYDDGLIISYENNILKIGNEEMHSISGIDSILDMYTSENFDEIIILNKEMVLSYNLNSSEISLHTIPDNITNGMNSFSQIQNKRFYGIDNYGILINDIENNDSWYSYLPNTIYKNQFDALALTEHNHLVGVVNHKDDNGQSGGFIYKNPLRISSDQIEISNFYSYNGYHINRYPLSESDFIANINNYWSGDNTVHSAVINNKNELYFSNSGIYPPAWLGHYEIVADNYSFSFSDETVYGGVVELKINTNEANFSINGVWNLANNLLGGNSGIFNPDWTNGFMTINQIIKDNNDNIWVVNPYSEHNNNSIAIKSNNKWYHIHSDDVAYIPQEITFDTNNNLWISYQFSQTMDNMNDYSPGGIRMVEYHNLTNQSDDIWHNSFLDELNGQNVWSIALSKDKYKNQILWLMTDYGIMGYILNESYTHSGNIMVDFTPIEDEYYFGDLSYQAGCKLRVDNQNNIWITTKTDGLRIIQNNGQLLDNNLGVVTVEEYGILSDNVYDVIFDDYGNVFIATEMGISILETSFNKNFSSNNVSISPNPFIIGEHTELIISNISKESIIKIMNLSGYVVKEFDMRYQNKYITWNGKSDDGFNLGSGIYLVSVFNNQGGTGATKLAIINK